MTGSCRNGEHGGLPPARHRRAGCGCGCGSKVSTRLESGNRADLPDGRTDRAAGRGSQPHAIKRGIGRVYHLEPITARFDIQIRPIAAVDDDCVAEEFRNPERVHTGLPGGPSTSDEFDLLTEKAAGLWCRTTVPLLGRHNLTRAQIGDADTVLQNSLALVHNRDSRGALTTGTGA
jgi:hypothetical protein